MNKSKEAKYECKDHSSSKFRSISRKKPKMELEGEFKNIKPPTYDAESKDAVEASFLNMNRYFEIYSHSTELKVKLLRYQLHMEAFLWQEEVRLVDNLEGIKVNWEELC